MVENVYTSAPGHDAKGAHVVVSGPGIWFTLRDWDKEDRARDIVTLLNHAYYQGTQKK